MSAHEPEDPLSDDALTADYRILQRVRGHRYSLDDVLTAWVAARRAPEALRVLDLGSGIGSVALMLAWKLEGARVTTIEAQAISLALQEKNVERNHVADRFSIVSGDFRDADVRLRAGGAFELITGTPPYFPANAVLASTDTQRAHARVELRGGVEAYLEAARELASPRAVIVVCADAKRPERVVRTASRLGLTAESELRVYPRQGKEALFSVWTLLHGSATQPLLEQTFVARWGDGARTPSQHEIRHFFGLSIDEHEASPPTRIRSGALA